MMILLVMPAAVMAGIVSPARVLLVEGDVMFRSPDSEEWLPAAVNTPLDESDSIWVPAESRTELQLADGSIVRLDSGSELDMISVEDGFTHIHLASGSLYLRTSPNAGKNALQIDADDTTVLPAARTRLRIDMLPNRQEDVSIFKGSAYVEGNGNRTKVRAGEHIALEEGHNELLPLNPPDSWEQWNSDRDLSQSRTITADSDLPDELRPFSGELAANGSWVRVPEYGMVWRPTVIQYNDWAPYRSGRWVWKGDDYVWVSYESWGWLPYHYGRWAVVGGFGWCWVPPARGDIYWGPGYVGWYHSGNYVGWTPLAPGETFYGYRPYGRHSVNVSTTPVNPATIRYRNRDVRGGLSILLQNDFLKGRTAFQRPANQSAISVAVSLGSPRIKSIRETRMPVIKQTPPRVSPPAIRQYNRDMRARFPRVAPATTPGSPSPARLNDEGRVRTPPPQPNPNFQGHRGETQTGQTEKHSAPGGTVHQREVTGQRHTPKDVKQKRVWKVTTVEQGSDKSPKETEGRERKGRR